MGNLSHKGAGFEAWPVKGPGSGWLLVSKVVLARSALLRARRRTLAKPVRGSARCSFGGTNRTPKSNLQTVQGDR
jgi:hypothetical protein